MDSASVCGFCFLRRYNRNCLAQERTRSTSASSKWVAASVCCNDVRSACSVDMLFLVRALVLFANSLRATVHSSLRVLDSGLEDDEEFCLVKRILGKACPSLQLRSDRVKKIRD